MNAVIRKNIGIKLNMTEIMEYLRVPEDLEEEFEDIFAECEAVADPCYMYAACEVSQTENTTVIGGHEFVSRIMYGNFKDLTVAWPYIITCGRGLYDLARKKDDPLERYWVDSIAEAYLRSLHPHIHSEVAAIAGVERLYSMNPGSLEDFPIACQRPLFDMLGDVMAAIGVELTESYLMLPYKSGSGIYFTSNSDYENCSMCPRANCPNRRAPYDGMMFETKYA